MLYYYDCECECRSEGAARHAEREKYQQNIGILQTQITQLYAQLEAVRVEHSAINATLGDANNQKRTIEYHHFTLLHYFGTLDPLHSLTLFVLSPLSNSSQSSIIIVLSPHISYSSPHYHVPYSSQS